ncbi:MAG: hemerythrin domain-containing protein [Deltaproteobacteria bacterium]|nr:hemerythrin domain-containing protein [Deltaproteobacteria bacterium]
MKPIQDLIMEHEAVKLTLKILDKICINIEQTGKISNPEHLDQLIEFFIVFVDKCHHGKEEELLFPALEAIGVVQKMNKAFSQYNEGDRAAATKLAKNARAYIALLRQHIDKENNVLFPIGDNRLSEEKKAELWEGFETIEKQKIGVGKHEEFHKMLEHLESVHLK